MSSGKVKPVDKVSVRLHQCVCSFMGNYGITRKSHLEMDQPNKSLAG